MDGDGLEINSQSFFTSNDKTVEDQIEFSELVIQLEKAIYRLKPRQRKAIIQRYYLDMSENEMISQLSLPRGTIKWLLFEARESLRAILAERK